MDELIEYLNAQEEYEGAVHEYVKCVHEVVKSIDDAIDFCNKHNINCENLVQAKIHALAFDLDGVRKYTEKQKKYDDEYKAFLKSILDRYQQ